MSSTDPSTNSYDFAVDSSTSVPPTFDEPNANLCDDMNEEWEEDDDTTLKSSNENDNNNTIIIQNTSTATPAHEDKRLKLTTGQRKSDINTPHSANVNDNEQHTPTVAIASHVNNAPLVDLGFARMNQDSSTSCSATINVNECNTPTATTMTHTNNAPPTGLLATVNETHKPNDDLRNHVQVANDVVHGISCEQHCVLHNCCKKKLIWHVLWCG